MKKLLGILILIGAIFVLYYVYTNPRETRLDNTGGVSEGFTPNPRSATFLFDEESITLSDGKSVSEEDGATDEVRLLEEKATGDINNDSKLDSIVFLARSGGGSGVFVYIAGFVSGPVNYRGTNAIYLGDRISPTSINIENGVITANYLDRNPDEAFAAEPTVPTYKEFVYKNGEIVER